ncbi:MAG: TrmH family RNA methyltransferase [Pseudomonadota bacterium]
MTESYAEKKARFDRMLTLFGRKPVLEALMTNAATPVCLHLADTNRPSAELGQLQSLAIERGADVKIHSREALSRISKNRRQDQGVALDLSLPHYVPSSTLARSTITRGLIAVDGVTNPQNLGMIIRSVGASPLDGILLASSGNARVDGLVVKASAGTIFRTPIYFCEQLHPALVRLGAEGCRIYGLDAGGTCSILDVPPSGPQVFVLGNETSGLSSNIRALCDDFVSIPLANGIESLNVSVAAALVAFRGLFAAGEHG